MLQIVIVTGLAGAGRSTALGALEDAGYEAVDNLPLALIPSIIEARRDAPEQIAIGIDSRSRRFHPDTVEALIIDLRERADVALQVVFLDCDEEVIAQRFTETRRRHPIHDRPVVDAIRREREVMKGLREIADLRIDTTRFSVHELRRQMLKRFGNVRGHDLRIELVSFSYRVGLPREADLVFDVRFLRNPHWQPTLRALTGLDPTVQAFVGDDPRTDPFLDRLDALFALLLQGYAEEGKSYLTIAFGCTGGKHRSVFIAETVAARLQNGGWPIVVRHREQGLLRDVNVSGERP
ncbi:MAG: RNase adapter RapZ [Pseudomonadota bacterium]